MNKIRNYAGTLFLVVGLLVMGFFAVHTRAQSETVTQIVVVPAAHYDQVILPPGDIVGFSCASGIKDVQPNCYVLIK
jgi:hypothetical protein